MSNLYVQDNSLKGPVVNRECLASFEILCFLEDRREVELTRAGHGNRILLDHLRDRKDRQRYTNSSGTKLPKARVAI
jgi:hypothetical protein